MAIGEPGRIENELSADLRRAVLDEIARSGLDAQRLAQRLDLVPTSVRALLGRDHWSLKTALTVADGLDLPLHIRVQRDLI